MKHKKLIFALTFASMFALGACNGNSVDNQQNVENVKITGLSITTATGTNTLTAGTTLQLTAKAIPDGAKSDVTWASLKEDVASVSTTGLVSGLKEGKVIIRATSTVDTKITKEIALTVEKEVEPDPTGIEINVPQGKAEVEVGAKLSLTAVVTPEKANQKVNWTSENQDIATVTPAGDVMGLKEGEATIVATSAKLPSLKKSIKITVIPAVVQSDKERWDAMDFSNHQQYIESKKATPIKIKGTVINVGAVNEKSEISYYIQNGKEGFFVKGHNISLGTPEVGKSYVVGGLKDYAFTGQHSVKDIEYFEALEEVLPVEIVDLTEATTLDYKESSAVLDARVKIDDAVISGLPASFEDGKGYNVDFKKGDLPCSIRVDRVTSSPELFEAITAKMKTLHLNQHIDLIGQFGGFGYGKPLSNITLLSADDVTIHELTVEQQAQTVLEEIKLPMAITADVANIDLPTTSEAFADAKISWESKNEAINAKTGAVTHAAKDTYVELVATATIGEVKVTKTFKVNVFAINDDEAFNRVATLDFEDSEAKGPYGCSNTKPKYNPGEITSNGHKWQLNSTLIAFGEDDRRVGQFSARMQTTYDDNSITLNEYLEFDTFEFKVAIYGKNKLGTVLNISYAVNDSTEYTMLDQSYVINEYAMTTYRLQLPVNTGDKVSVRISAKKGTGQRVNIDDIRLLASK